MKFSLFKNDKSTVKDELILALIVVIPAILGVLLLVKRPTIWIFEETVIISVGVILVMIAVMFFPSLVWRLMTNYDNTTKKSNKHDE